MKITLEPCNAEECMQTVQIIIASPTAAISEADMPEMTTSAPEMTAFKMETMSPSGMEMTGSKVTSASPVKTDSK